MNRNRSNRRNSSRIRRSVNGMSWIRRSINSMSRRRNGRWMSKKNIKRRKLLRRGGIGVVGPKYDEDE